MNWCGVVRCHCLGFVPKGVPSIHEKPSQSQMKHSRVWLEGQRFGKRHTGLFAVLFFGGGGRIIIAALSMQIIEQNRLFHLGVISAGLFSCLQADRNTLPAVTVLSENNTTTPSGDNKDDDETLSLRSTTFVPGRPEIMPGSTIATTVTYLSPQTTVSSVTENRQNEPLSSPICEAAYMPIFKPAATIRHFPKPRSPTPAKISLAPRIEYGDILVDEESDEYEKDYLPEDEETDFSGQVPHVWMSFVHSSWIVLTTEMMLIRLFSLWFEKVSSVAARRTESPHLACHCVLRRGFSFANSCASICLTT